MDLMAGFPGYYDENEVTGLVTDIIFSNPVNGYTVASINDENGVKVTVTGIMPYLSCGESLIATGAFADNSRYGKQFNIEKCERYLPDTPLFRLYLDMPSSDTITCDEAKASRSFSGMPFCFGKRGKHDFTKRLLIQGRHRPEDPAQLLCRSEGISGKRAQRRRSGTQQLPLAGDRIA